MVEMIVGTYGVLCWLVFKKFKLVPITTYTVCTAILIGAVMLGFIAISTSIFHPQSTDGRMYAPVVQIVPNVRGTVIEVPIQPNTPVKQGDVLFKIDPTQYQTEVDRLRALLTSKNTKFAGLSEQLAAAEAATKSAKSNLLVSESQLDRQARENVDQSNARVEQVGKQLTLARQNLARVERMRPVADHHDTSLGAVAVAWTLQNPAVDGAIVGFRRPDQVDPIVDAANLELSQEDVATIEASD